MQFSSHLSVIEEKLHNPVYIDHKQQVTSHHNHQRYGADKRIYKKGKYSFIKENIS
jgi:hypothetical protein